jgi:Peptidase family M3
MGSVQSRLIGMGNCFRWTLPLVCGLAAAVPVAADTQLASLESAYADFNDATGAVGLIDSDPTRYETGYDGKERAVWEQVYKARRTQLLRGLKQLHSNGQSASDRRAAAVMREALNAAGPTPASLAPVAHCADAQRHDQSLRALQQALYGCFAELGNRVPFDGGTLTRVDALGLLSTLQESGRRKQLFQAFGPLWHALNGGGEADSPYRRMIRRTAREVGADNLPPAIAARTVGVSLEESERWLERILDTWRQVSGDAEIEPWDYRFQAEAGVSALDEFVRIQGMQALNYRCYQDLGLDLAGARVIYDLKPRTGKAPLAYTDFVLRGRQQAGKWRPTVVHVSASYTRATLGELNELVHENGHAAHMLALRTRPAFMDLGDPIFYEAFADVPSWSVYEPAWQEKYLGRSAREPDSLRALFANVMLDVAWALFEIRLLRDPSADPNQLWTHITQRYLHIRPHPEYSWWAVRVQLVDIPGYMVNYGLGSVITADLRQRIMEQLGPFATGEPRWFSWLSRQLLASGEEFPTSQLLRQFLGRPVSPDALLAQLRRLSASNSDRMP